MIYSTSSIQYDGTQKESIDDIIVDDRVVPSKSDDFVSEGIDIVLSMTENYNMVMEHIGRSELLALEQTGEPLVYIEGVIGSIFSTIKKFLSKVWEKIKSLFKRFIMMIDSYTKNDKAFVNKYRQQIYRHKSLSDFTFKGYVYTIDTGKIGEMMKGLVEMSDIVLKDIKNPGMLDYSKGDDIQKNTIDKLDDIMEDNRGKILKLYGGKDGKFTSEEFRKELKELLRNGESEKRDLDGNNSNEIDVDGMVTELQNYRETKKTIDTVYKDSKKAIDEDNKTVDRLSKEHSNRDMSDADSIGFTIAGKFHGAKGKLKGLDKVKEYWIKKKGLIIDDDSDLDVTNKKQGDHIIIKGHFPDGTPQQLTYVVAAPNKSGNPLVVFTNKELHQREGKLIQVAFRIINQTKACLVDVDTTVLQALKERSRQYKACLVKIVYHNPKNEESYNESYSYPNQFQNSFISPLSNIEFK